MKTELAYRQTARTNLRQYIDAIEIPGVPASACSIDEDADQDDLHYVAAPKQLGAHHEYWIERLQDVADGKIRRLLGMMPPGSAKSTYTSVVFPTFYMGREPGSQIITASYASDLPRKFGRRARSIARQKQYLRIFDTELSRDSTAADEWELTNGSSFMGCGMLAGVTGNRADGIMLDDPIKGREAADSETIRNKTWDAYFDDLLSRKKPDAWEIICTTRWHEDDPAGRILPEDYEGETGWIDGRDGNRWFVVCFPAECERNDDPIGRQLGERLWPEWFGPDHFEPFKTNVRTWSSLYQQRPAPEQGLFFSKDQLREYDALPADCRIYCGSDYAVSDGTGDWTVHMLAGHDRNGNVYIDHIWRDQKTADVWVQAAIDIARIRKPLMWAEEAGQIEKSVGPFLAKEMQAQRVFYARQQFTSTKDKPTRARSAQALWQNGKVFLKRGAPWRAAFERELFSFPAGANDDQVDAFSIICRMLDEMTGIHASGNGRQKMDRWDRAFARSEIGNGSNSWKTV